MLWIMSVIICVPLSPHHNLCLLLLSQEQQDSDLKDLPIKIVALL